MNYYTPGVYVEEISTLPPSVVSVSTAVPAFIGYTQKGPVNTPTRISTLLEYTSIFGGPDIAAYTVETDGENILSLTRDTNSGNYLMYYHLNMYFNNGGGSCYIISVGNYGETDNLTPERSHFEAGLSSLEKEDEPTLILLTDAINLDSIDYYSLCSKALMQCGKLKDRFAILDILNGDDKGEDFRNASLPSEYLKYGAAYTPYLRTVLTYHYEPEKVQITGLNAPQIATYQTDENGIQVTYTGFPDEKA